MLHFNCTQIIFFFKFYQSLQKKLFLNTLLDDIYTAVYVHVSTRFFYKNVPMEIKRNKTFFKNSAQIYSIRLEISLISFINQGYK